LALTEPHPFVDEDASHLAQKTTPYERLLGHNREIVSTTHHPQNHADGEKDLGCSLHEG
jgi:hypothetical protein